VFTILPSNAATISIPDIARGPGQPVNIPASGSGIPVRISNGAGVQSVDFTFVYDPNLLTITGVVAGASLPADALIEPNLATPGVVRVSISLPTGLNAGAQDLVLLQATVPASAPYRAKHVLHFTEVKVNELQAVGDDAIHLVAYLGDATGTGTYSSLDGQRILRVAAGLDSGFALFPLLDPVIIGDTTGNGAISSLDATRILQEVVGIDQPTIPPLPGIIIPPAVADPLVSMPTDITGTPNSVVSVPVLIDDANLLETVVLRIAYDTTLLDVTVEGIRPGSLTAGGDLLVNVDESAGVIYISLLTQPALTAGSGSLLEIDFQIRSEAVAETTLIDIQSLSLNEGQLVLTVEPLVGPDATDGRITILASSEAMNFSRLGEQVDVQNIDTQSAIITQSTAPVRTDEKLSTVMTESSFSVSLNYGKVNGAAYNVVIKFPVLRDLYRDSATKGRGRAGDLLDVALSSLRQSSALSDDGWIRPGESQRRLSSMSQWKSFITQWI
jgi:hypothetical protein